MCKLRLSGETISSVDDPKWETVEVALTTINTATNAFVLLERGEFDFVQTCGEPSSLVVEWSFTKEGKQVINRVGRKGPKITKDPNINEAPFVLDLTDALILFEAFYQNLSVPRHYRLLDITNQVCCGERRSNDVKHGRPPAHSALPLTLARPHRN